MDIDNKCESKEVFQERIYKWRGMHIVNWFEKVQQFCIKSQLYSANIWVQPMDGEPVNVMGDFSVHSDEIGIIIRTCHIATSSLDCQQEAARLMCLKLF